MPRTIFTPLENTRFFTRHVWDRISTEAVLAYDPVDFSMEADTCNCPIGIETPHTIRICKALRPIVIHTRLRRLPAHEERDHLTMGWLEDQEAEEAVAAYPFILDDKSLELLQQFSLLDNEGADR